MKFIRFALGFTTFALAVATAASSYSVTLMDPTWVGQNQLKPGQYKVQVEGNKAVFKSGKNVVEVPATVEKNPQKYANTVLETSSSKLQEIHVGGTNTKIVFNSNSGSAEAGH